MEVVSSMLVNVSDSLSQHIAGTSVKSNDGGALLNADLALQLRHVERTLSSLQRNLDDFYFVTLTAITFGKYTATNCYPRLPFQTEIKNGD